MVKHDYQNLNNDLEPTSGERAHLETKLLNEFHQEELASVAKPTEAQLTFASLPEVPQRQVLIKQLELVTQ